MGTKMVKVVTGGGVELTFSAQTGNYGRADILVKSPDYPHTSTVQLNKEDMREIRDMLDKILGSTR